MLSSRYVALAKVESTYNTDPTPTASDDAILVENLQIGRPVEIVERNEDIGNNSLSPFRPIVGRYYGQVSFDVELKGSGAAGTAPDLGVLLLACGFDETVVASTSVTYAPVSTSMDSITLYLYRDGVRHRFTGCRGNVAFRFPAGGKPIAAFTFSGHYVTPDDQSVPTPTLDSTVPAAVRNTSFSVGSYSAVISSLDVDMGNSVNANDDINGADGYGVMTITGRSAQGSIDPEATLVATRDWFGVWVGGTAEALTITIGSTAGNILTVTAPALVHREISDGDRNGILTYDIPFTLARSSGDDEISLAFT